MQNCLRHLWTIALCLLFASPAFSQVSGQAPEYSDSDKKKIAELEQKPETKARIQRLWDDKRRADLQFIYRLNIDERTHTNNDKKQDFATNGRIPGHSTTIPCCSVTSMQWDSGLYQRIRRTCTPSNSS